MSNNKYTSRGFGASGAAQSSYKAPRESYAPTRDTGSSFVFGGGTGLRGSPKSGGQSSSSALSSIHTSPSPQASKLFDVGASGKAASGDAEKSRGIDLSGGDITTTKLQRTAMMIGLLVAALTFSALVRACAVGADSSWVHERRAHINPDDAE